MGFVKTNGHQTTKDDDHDHDAFVAPDEVGLSNINAKNPMIVNIIPCAPPVNRGISLSC